MDNSRIDTYNMIIRISLNELEAMFHLKEKGIKIRPSDKLVWLVFHNHAHLMEGQDEYCAKLSLKRISDNSIHDIKTVQKAIKKLERMGVIKMVKRGTDKNNPSIWKVKHLRRKREGGTISKTG